MRVKLCLVCKRAELEPWESACNHCWNELTDKHKKYMVVLNHIREALRSCGIDLFDPPWD